MPLSVIDPLDRAWHRMVDICFRPFQFAKWFSLGFCAFLAALGTQGFSSSFNYGRSPGPSRGPTPFDGFLPWVLDHVAITILIACAILLLVFAFSGILTWLRCRGKFMLIDNIAHNTSQIVRPWKEFKTLANSAFLFSFGVQILSLGSFFVLGVGAFLLVLPDIRTNTFGPVSLTVLIVGGLVFAIVTLFFAIIVAIMNNFIFPLMYVRHQNVRAAWSAFRHEMLPGNGGSIALFLLFLIPLWIAATIAMTIAICLSCCVAILPYLSSVVTLPIWIFFQSYSMYYVEQLGPQFRMMQTIERRGFEVVPTTDTPPSPSSFSDIPPPT